MSIEIPYQGLLDHAQMLKGPKPEGATSVYKVTWFIQLPNRDLYQTSLSKASKELINHKFFISKEKAEKLKADLDAAFKTLGYVVEGRCTITEDWYE